MAFGTDSSNRMGSPQAVGTTFYNKSINQSLMFNDADQPALSKTYGTAQTDTKKLTISVWVKRGDLGVRSTILFAKSGGAARLNFTTGDEIYFNAYNTGYNGFTSDAKFRDVGAWYHIVAVADSDAAGNLADIHKVYVNGKIISGTRSGTFIPTNTATMLLRNGVTTYIGDDTDGSYHFDGYLAEMHVIDGTVYGPEFFGENKNGVWIPKQVDSTTVNYGTNGFHLDFKGDTSGSAVLFGPSQDNITWTHATNFDIATSDDFCLEFFFKGDISSSYSYGIGDYQNSGFLWQFSSGDNIYFYTGIGASIGPFDVTGHVTASTWHHYAISRHSGTYYIYVDGVQRGTSSTAGTAGFNNARFQVGDAHPSAGAPHLDGAISNLRFTVGSARYPSGTTFTVPTSTLTSDSTDVKLLAFTTSDMTKDSSSFNNSGAVDEGSPVYQSYGPLGGAPLSNDKSGQNNHYDLTNVVDGDVLTDSPTNNYATLNKLTGISDIYAEGNLTIQGNSGVNYFNTMATMAMETGKKYYFEVSDNGRSSTYHAIGIVDPKKFTHTMSVYNTVGAMAVVQGQYVYNENSQIGTSTNYYDATARTWDFAIDLENNLFHYRVDNGAWQNSGNPVAGTGGYAIPANMQNIDLLPFFGPNGTTTMNIDFGQKGFTRTPPAGFIELKANNITEPPFSPRSESIENSYFYTTLYEGNAGGQRVGQFLPLTEVKSVNNAILFNDDDTQDLSYTPSASNRRTWTWSGWVKRGNLGVTVSLMDALQTSGTDWTRFHFNSSDKLAFAVEISNSNIFQFVTTQVFRDPSAWYHIVAAYDSTQATSTNRFKLYVNGEQVTAFDTETYGAQDTDSHFNSAIEHTIGAVNNGIWFFDGYMADIHFVDGLQLDASYFGQTDPSTEKWIPKTYSGSHGTNGFHLEFENNNALLDSAGSNHFDANTGNPIIIGDSPTDNFPVLNTLPSNFSGTLAKGNLQTTVAGFSSTVYGGGRSTIPIPKTGKWYCEFRCMATGDLWSAGVSKNTDVPSIGNVAGPGAIAVYNRSVYLGYENDYGSGENQLAGLGITKFASGDVVGIHIDMDAGGKVWFSHNGTQFDAPLGHQAGSGAQGDPAAGTNEIGLVFNPDNEDLFFHVSGGSSTVCHANFGQNPSFNGSFTGGSIGTQVREGGTFKYMPATGYNPLRVDLFLNQTKGIARRKTPVFTWIKNRDATDSHMLFDKVRGVGKVLHSDVNAAETTEPDTLQKFLPGGFQIGNDVQVNTVNESYVAWNWCMHDDVVQDTPTGSGFSNGVRLVDPRVGLSIITYTATAGTGTIDHGLGVVPDMTIATDRVHDTQIYVWHSHLTNANAGTHMLVLDTNSVEYNPGVNHMNDTAPTANAFAFGGYLGAHADTASNGQTKLLYSFKAVPGFSAFGTFVGNNNDNGPYIHCGFKPAWVMIKPASNAQDWSIIDNTRNPVNINDSATLQASVATAEGSFADNAVDFVSNGFKLRDATSGASYINGSYTNIVYWAMAESPFKYTNAR